MPFKWRQGKDSNFQRRALQARALPIGATLPKSVWWEQPESNQHPMVRSHEFYPLNYVPELESRNRFALLNGGFADHRVGLLRHRPVEIMMETVGVEPTSSQVRLSHPWRMFRSTMPPKIHKNYQIDLPLCHRPLTHPSGTGSPSIMGMDLDLSLGSFHQCFP